MPDSVGAGGFPRNINIGHEHLDLSSGFTYQYQGGVPTDILSWKIINGVSATDPSPLGWGTKQLGAMWFNRTSHQYKYWNGISIIVLNAPYAPYTGFVATRGLQPDMINSTNRQVMSRTPHFSRTLITSFRIIIPNWYINSSLVETGSGSGLDVTASIEYPSGTFTRVTFSGSITGTVPNNSLLISDPITVTIPDDTLFWSRIYGVSTTGIVQLSSQGIGATALGNGLEQGVSGITDKTMGGTVTNVSQGYGPIALIGTTSYPSYLMIGDSIMFGTTDVIQPNGFGDIGPWARAVGPLYGYVKCARTGDTAFRLVSSHTNRGALFKYATHFITNYGSNDLFVSGRSSAQLQTDLTTISGYQASLGIGGLSYFSTISPRNQSSDGWITLINQSQSNAAAEANRITVNTFLRGLTIGPIFETANALESSLNSGLWLVNPSANFYTPDGTHPTSDAIISLMMPAISIT